MGIRIVDALAVEPFGGSVAPEQVVRVIELVAALAEHGAVVLFADGFCSGNHVVRRADGHAGEHFCLRNVWREDGGQREQALLERVDCVVADELGAACGDHHGIDDEIFRAVFLKLLRDDFNQADGGNHTGFDRIRADVGKDAVELQRQKVRRDLEDSLNAGGVLRDEGGDGAHGVYTVCGHRFDVGLNSGASAGVGPSDCQCCFHVFLLFAFLFYSGKRWCPQPTAGSE